MRINTKAIKGSVAAIGLACSLIMGFEGKSNDCYLDPIDIPTICYGHTATAELGQTLSDADCTALLRKDVRIAMEDINRYVKVELTDNQRAAFTSFVYNVGGTNFRTSTLLKKLNKGDYTGACNELPRWVYANKVKLNGLVNRRGAEKALCLNQSNLKP